MDKRKARSDYKSKKTPKGIFAIRCTSSGAVWVSASDHLDTAKNGLWFMLRHGSHYNKQLQAEWNTQGEPTFEYQVVETLDEDVPALSLRDLLRERQKHWESELGAAKV